MISSLDHFQCRASLSDWVTAMICSHWLFSYVIWIRKSLSQDTLNFSESILILLDSDLCQRRQWPEPIYRLFPTGPGWICVARVNNREYQTDTIHENERLAQENAAMRAYLICQNFSKSDGMYPSGHKGRRGGDVVQGLPVAIGTERMSVYTDDSRSSGSRSGGSSPTTAESGHSYGSSSGSQNYGGIRRISA